MTTSNDETTPSPDAEATTPLPKVPTPTVGAEQDATREMPTSDPQPSSDPLAVFREAPPTQMPADPFRSDADASGAARTQGQGAAPAQGSGDSGPVGGSRTAFDPAFTGETASPAGAGASAATGTHAPSGTPGHGGAAQQTWSAPSGPVDIRTLPEAPSRGVRVGSFVWAALVCMTGFFLIAEAFIPAFNLPILGISAIAALGIVLILTALFSGRGSKRPKGKADATRAADTTHAK